MLGLPLILRKNWISLGLGFFYFLLQFIANGWFGFGYLNDEMYYMACTKRLDFGYVDHPPLSILILKVVLSIGDSIPILRFLPAFLGGWTVAITGIVTRKLGGNTVACILACVAVIASPVLMVLFGFYSMNSIEVFLFASFSLVVISILKENRPRWWILAFIIVGLALENKHTFILYVGAFFLGMLFSKERRHFKTPWFWLGCLCVVLLMLPNLLWQIQNQWPSIEFYRNATMQKNIDTNFMGVIADQVLAQNPTNLILWLAGLVYLLRGKQTSQLRPFAWTFIILLGVMIFSQSSRPDRIASVYPILFAAGARAISANKRKWFSYAALILVTLGGFVFAPAGLPILPAKDLSLYASKLGVIPKIEKGDNAALPIWFGNRMDWDKLYAKVYEVYLTLPEKDRKSAAIYTSNYGQAGAIELWSKYTFPVISGHNSYYFWGKANQSWKVIVAVGIPKENLQLYFAEVHQAGSYTREYSNEKNVPIYTCKKLRIDVAEAWEKGKHFQ